MPGSVKKSKGQPTRDRRAPASKRTSATDKKRRSLVPLERFGIMVAIGLASTVSAILVLQLYGVGSQFVHTEVLVGQPLVQWNMLDSGGEPQVFSYQIVNEYPHDPDAFSQGIFYFGNNTMYESNGMRGESNVRWFDLATGNIIESFSNKGHEFGEGLTLWGDNLIQLLWQTNEALIYERKSLGLPDDVVMEKRRVTYTPMKDGWGLTNSSTELVGSDSSPYLYFMDPETQKENRRVRVRDGAQDIHLLNELEYIDGLVWANIWYKECIAQIDPKSGKVVGWLLLHGLLEDARASAPNRKRVDVLNGIAYDPLTKRIFVTGKRWPKIYEISLQPTWKGSIDVAYARRHCIPQGNRFPRGS
mmetsp:Transcript_13418/g.48834  ORF Transcript_13418/g.48834 Transcript_13418/m.48834 type:complete len:360 (-) Transcript_13418:1755-2834(-)